MVETIQQIISIVLGSLAMLSALTGFIFSLVKNCKNKKIAQTAQTANDICELATQKVAEVEKLFSRVAGELKSVGVKTGEIKKESVMSFISERCTERGIVFDPEYWSDKIEKIVAVLTANKG